MNTPLSFFSEESIARADIRFAREGFRYGFIADVFQEGAFLNLVEHFPSVEKFKRVDKMSGGGRKRFFVGPEYASGKDDGCLCSFFGAENPWRLLAHEAARPDFVGFFSGVMGVSFNSLCNFGLTFGNEGCVQEPHIDGAAREGDPSPVHSTWASIVYFNTDPNPVGGTCVYAPDRTTMLFSAPSMRNGLFFFEQHPAAWHGFPVMPKGAERRILSLSYSNEPRPIALRDSLSHKMTCKKFWKSMVRS